MQVARIAKTCGLETNLREPLEPAGKVQTVVNTSLYGAKDNDLNLDVGARLNSYLHFPQLHPGYTDEKGDELLDMAGPYYDTYRDNDEFLSCLLALGTNLSLSEEE